MADIIDQMFISEKEAQMNMVRTRLILSGALKPNKPSKKKTKKKKKSKK